MIKTNFIEGALGLRQADQEVDFQLPAKKIKDHSHPHNISLENTSYCVLLEVYGDKIVYQNVISKYY